MNITLKQPVKSPAVITQGFGDTAVDYSRFGLKGHNGVDYAGKLGDPIFAMADGRVEKIAYDPKGLGNHIILRHDGFRTLYAHLKRAMVYRGDLISAEKQIAEMGYSGFVVPSDERGTHLHVGLIFDDADKNNGYGGYVDPLEYIRFSEQELAHAEESTNENGSSNNENDDSINKIVQIVSKVAPNARRTPGGQILFQVARGVELQATGRTHAAAGLLWRELLFPIWIAERDWDGTRILEQQ